MHPVDDRQIWQPCGSLTDTCPCAVDNITAACPGCFSVLYLQWWTLDESELFLYSILSSSSVDENMTPFHSMASSLSVSFPPWYVYKSIHFIESTWSINKNLNFVCFAVCHEIQAFLGGNVKKAVKIWTAWPCLRPRGLVNCCLLKALSMSCH